MKNEIQRALPEHLKPDRIIRIAQTAFSANPKLQECSQLSIIAGIIQSSQMGLEINSPLGQAYLIPYKTKGQYEAQFQIGYLGQLELAHRTNRYKTIAAFPVYSNDFFEYQLGTDMFIKHKPADDPEGEPTHYYASYELHNGGKGFYVMSKATVVKHATKFSQAFKSGFGPWKDHFIAMALKTALKKMLHLAPKSIEMAKWISQDESVKKEIDKDMSVIPNSINYDDK